MACFWRDGRTHSLQLQHVNEVVNILAMARLKRYAILQLQNIAGVRLWEVARGEGWLRVAEATMEARRSA